jgi:membrane protein implicated in regulation of membrane protease activity
MSEEDTGPEGGLQSETESALSLTREEMQATFEYQVGRLQEIDNKAVEILKANLLLIGILVTAGSILVQTEFRTEAFLNVFTITGGLLLFVSTALAGVTYTASNLRGGLNADAVERTIRGHERGDREGFEKQLLRSYGRWIEYNAKVTAVNDILVTATVLLVIVSFAYVVVGVIVATAELSTVLTAVAFVGFTVPMAWLVRLAYHMDHLGTPSEERDIETFPGVRLSKGATRNEGYTALKRMFFGSRPLEETE